MLLENFWATVVAALVVPAAWWAVPGVRPDMRLLGENPAVGAVDAMSCAFWQAMQLVCSMVTQFRISSLGS